MPRYSAALLALATLSTTALVAQAPDAAGSASTYTQSQPAPVQRAYTPAPQSQRPPRRDLSGITTQQPAQGVYIRIGAGGAMSTVSKTADQTEIRVDKGVVNVSVHHPANGALILVDLPGGQVDLLKDGFYTFNAQTNTVHVLKGEARAFLPSASDKGSKVKEYQQFVFIGGKHTTDLDPVQARADVLPFPRPNGGGYLGDGPRYYNPYGGGFYPAYYGYGYPYGYYGYPFVGIGFGYGFYGGYGFRGGYYGGFHSRR